VIWHDRREIIESERHHFGATFYLSFDDIAGKAGNDYKSCDCDRAAITKKT
jgi:hypothetical protein